MLQRITRIIKMNPWKKRLAEVTAVCIVVGICLMGDYPEEQKQEILTAGDEADVINFISAFEEEENPALEVERYDLGDLDGNGQAEYIEIINEAESFGCDLSFHFNGESIYQYKDSLWIFDIEDVAYIDLDQDGKEEIFFSFLPSVNSAPLVEYAVLKKTDNGWKALEMIHGEDVLDNAFPISCRYGKENTMVIACEGLEKQIVYDFTAHYEKCIQEYGGSYIKENSVAELWKEYKEGDSFGQAAAWGIWEIRSGSCEGRSCLIATHGLDGPGGWWDTLGKVEVYFDYNEEGRVHILDMAFLG